MTRYRPLRWALLAALPALAACVATPGAGIDGRWQSDDGVSVTTFSNGAFETRVIATGEVVAEGTYRAGADGLRMSWFSIVGNEERSAVCRYATPRNLSCELAGGSAFSMTRIA